MRFLPTALHGVIDYAAALGLIVGPLLLFPVDTPIFVSAIPMVAGVALIIYSLITDYSASARRVIPFGLHLAIDFAAGATFVALGLLAGFTGIVQAFYLVMGFAVIAVVLTSKTDSGESADTPPTVQRTVSGNTSQLSV